MSNPPSLSRQQLRFGPFLLNRSRRLLLVDGQPVRIGNRALDLLLALVERPGEVVAKDDLIAQAWPDTIVDDNNLRVHIAALRRALRTGAADGDDDSRYILNVAGRGYSFVGVLEAIAPVNVATPAVATTPIATTHRAATSAVPAFDAQTLPALRSQGLPGALTQVIGREAAIATVVQQVPERRLVTIVGTGGVGKSTLALAAAASLSVTYPQGRHFVDLAAIGDPADVPIALATVIGLAIPSHTGADLPALLRNQRMLLVVDNCEHVIAAAAELLERILRTAAGVHILATSREPLGVEGEYLYRLGPLETPPPTPGLRAAEALQFTAVQLFVERARTGAQSFELTDANAVLAGDICRRLDGIPLAIELAVSRLNLFGIGGLAARLDQHFLTLAQYRRTAAARHQTLHATLDWSYALLGSVEQTVLRRLAIFNGAFTLESAVAVAAQDGLDAATVVDAVIGLAAKSLIASAGQRAGRHRLLYTTRTFALEKLAQTSDATAIQRWHAEHHRQLLRGLENEWEQMPKADWIGLYGETINDIRAALDWAFSKQGDGMLGAELTAAAIPFSFQLALMDEFRERVEQALAFLTQYTDSQSAKAQHPPKPDSRQQALYSQLATTLQMLRMNSRGISSAISSTAGTLAEMSERHDSPKQQLEPLVNDAVAKLEMADYGAASAAAARLQEIAQRMDDPIALLLAERLAAQTAHNLGQHARAREQALRVLAHPAPVIPLSYHRLAVDRRVSMRVVLARVAWHEGRAEQALVLVDEALEFAATDGPFSQCHALALCACPVALWCGDIGRAEKYLQQLFDVTTRYRIEHWHKYGLGYAQGVQMAGSSSAEKRRFAHGLQAVALGADHRLDTMLTIDPDVIDDAALAAYVPLLSGTEPGARFHGWCTPETLRVLGERILAGHADPALLAQADIIEPDRAAHAEQLFQRALDLAHAQGALAWELRAALSLARRWQNQQRAAQARDLLAPIHARFTEGHATCDVRAAAALLAIL